MKLLVLDNYDSFTYNLVHLVEKVSPMPFTVAQHDKISLSEVNAFDKILLSPGPGLPSEAGIMPQLIQTYHQNKSIFGVCLGLQAIGEAFGASLKNLDRVYHGLSMPVNVIERDFIFNNCPNTFMAGRYHSWVINEQQAGTELIVTATDNAGLIMAARHKYFDVRGVQFHPESILSEHGQTIISNWINN